MEAIGRRWYVILSMLVCRDQLLRPEVQAVSCCQDLWSQPSSSEMDIFFLSSAAFSFLAWSSRTSWSAWMSGLDFPVRGISLRRSVHDAGFVCGCDRWGTLCFFGIVCGHFFCWAACLGPLFGGDIRLGSLGLGPEQT